MKDVHGKTSCPAVTVIGHRRHCIILHVQLCHINGITTADCKTTRMWANARRDGRPAEYRWCPLFNAAKFGTRPLLECRAVTLPRRETRWNLHGWPKLLNRSQPLVGRSSPYYEDVWRIYCCLTIFFFWLLIHALVAKIHPNKVVQWCQDGDFLRPVFPASRVQHISDLHPKFALRPHHV